MIGRVGVAIIFFLFLARTACADGPAVLPSVKNSDWEQRCAECHVLYHPGLLPERSWRALMNSPTKHFGRNIGVAKTDAAITEFLAANAADRSRHPVSRAIAESLPTWRKPVAISELEWFKTTHQKLRKVEHFHACAVCHRDAAQGSFAVIHE